MRLENAILSCLVDGCVCANAQTALNIRFEGSKLQILETQVSAAGNWVDFKEYNEDKCGYIPEDGWNKRMELVFLPNKRLKDSIPSMKQQFEKSQKHHESGVGTDIYIPPKHYGYFLQILNLAEKQLIAEEGKGETK